MICKLDSDQTIAGESAVKMSNVMTRGFKVDSASWNKFPTRIIACDAVSKNKYLERIKNELDKKRDYYNIGSATCDNMASVEKLGLGNYTRKNVYVLDFSSCFNLILAKMTGSNLKIINELLPNSATDDCNRSLRLQEEIDVSKIMSLTPECVKYFASLVRYNNGCFKDIVLQKVLETLHDIMGYVFIDYQKYLQDNHNISIVLRSYTFFELIFTTDDNLENEAFDQILINYNGGQIALRAKLQPEEIIVL